MPGRDRSGPMGMGAMTGRGAGGCTVNNSPALVAGRGLGRGLGLGRSWGGVGGGRGGRYGFNFTGTYGAGRFAQQGGLSDQVDEKELLVNQERALQVELDAVKSRISVIESEPEK